MLYIIYLIICVKYRRKAFEHDDVAARLKEMSINISKILMFKLQIKKWIKTIFIYYSNVNHRQT